MKGQLNRRQFSALLGSSALFAPSIVRAQSERAKQFEGTKLRLLAVQFSHHQSLWAHLAEFYRETGILVDIEYKRKNYIFPLADLEVIEKSSSNYLPIKDYVVWFANR